MGLSSLHLLTMHSLSQAGPLGGLHRAAPVPFRASYFSRVGAGRTAELCLPTPLSEPGMHLSAHPALQGLAFRSMDFSWVRHAVTVTAASAILRDHRLTPASGGTEQLLDRATSIPCRPSPCTRLSRAPTTMAAPTLTRFIDGLLISPCQPPTFTPMHSTKSRRQRLSKDPSRSLRNPEWGQDKSR